MTAIQEDNVCKVASLMTRVTDQDTINRFLKNTGWFDGNFTHKAFFQCGENIVVTGRGSGSEIQLLVQTTDDEFFVVYDDGDTSELRTAEAIDIMFLVETITRTTLHCY